LLFGIKTLNAGFVEVLIYYIPSFVAITLGYSVIARGVRQSFWSEVYEVAMCIYMWLTTTLTLLWPKRAKFQVTPKGGLSDKMSFNWQIVLPQLLLVALTVFGIIMAIVRAIYTPEYTGGIYTNLFWSLYNLVLLVGAIYVAQERPQFRLTPRIYKGIRAEVRLLDGTIAVGYTTNISENGLAVVFEEPIPVSGTIPLKLLDWDINESSLYQVQAIRSSVDASNRHYIGFRVINRTDEQHQQLIRHMFGNADVWAKDHHYVGAGASFLSLLTTPIRLAGREERPINRKTARFQSTLSVALDLAGQHMIGVSNEISESGMSVLVKNAGDVKKDHMLPIRVQWTTGQITELSAQVMRAEAVAGGQTKLGLNFVNLTRQQRLELIQQIYRPRESVVRVAPSVHKILHCAVTLPGGQRASGYTQEISEMGTVVALQEKATLEQDMPVLLDIQWDDGKQERYRAVVKGIRENGNPVALLYFDRLDLKTLDALSARIHQPMESKAFDTLMS
jgi:c-di-GMP-binding flagellar brake protein YcgR